MVTAHSAQTAFGVDDDAFGGWVSAQGDELEGKLPDPRNSCAGSALSDLVYEALSAGVLVGDPRLELNVHSDGVGYLLRLNNATGCQQSVGLIRGWREIHWPPAGLAYDESARYYLQEICNVADALLDDLSGHFGQLATASPGRLSTSLAAYAHLIPNV